MGLNCGSEGGEGRGEPEVELVWGVFFRGGGGIGQFSRVVSRLG